MKIGTTFLVAREKTRKRFILEINKLILKKSRCTTRVETVEMNALGLRAGKSYKLPYLKNVKNARWSEAASSPEEAEKQMKQWRMFVFVGVCSLGYLFYRICTAEHKPPPHLPHHPYMGIVYVLHS
jgi:hypothetical protein